MSYVFKDYIWHRFILKSYNDIRIIGYYLLGLYHELDTVLMLSLHIINDKYNQYPMNGLHVLSIHSISATAL